MARALVLERDGEGEHVVVDDPRPSAVVALDAATTCPSMVFSRM
ncbi:hypothetical protein ACFRQM_13735 [Streptomyces sp. NPDC056831]